MTSIATKVVTYWNEKATPEEREALVRDFADATGHMGAASRTEAAERGPDAGGIKTYDLVGIHMGSKGKVVLTLEVGYAVGRNMGLLISDGGITYPSYWPRTDAGLARLINSTHRELVSYGADAGGNEEGRWKGLVAAMAKPSKVTQKALSSVLDIKYVPQREVTLTVEHIKDWVGYVREMEAFMLPDAPFVASDEAKQILAYPYSSDTARREAQAYLDSGGTLPHVWER